ncbi:MAG: hypothetical protein JO257_03520 [Deltaproteobacteria bacterium]|nr:hypothetical protein [Deltaproteobacteria bacterium]
MIRIRRPSTVPNPLVTNGRQRRDEHIADHATGKTDFTFDRDVYGHADVKIALRTAQHDKCAFCESKVSHVAFGDVEHFRPKAAFRRQHGEALTSPAYFWLAYDWTNLLFACEPCNRRHKGNLFPLVDETARARSAADDVTRENPVFIDPASEDPTVHIGFREEFAYAIGGSVRADATVHALGLDRPELVERRRERLQAIRLLRLAARTLKRKRDQASKALAREIETELTHATDDSAEYAAMIRCAEQASP